MKYFCPLCKSAITKANYERVLKTQMREEERISEQATLVERKRGERLFKGQPEKMETLQERLRMWGSGTTPQMIGLSDEPVLVARLSKEFPTDRIEHTGKGGDVIHFVLLNGNEAGCIVYECKHTKAISRGHVVQTVLAKRTRNAHFAILVTTGKRKGFSGLDQEEGVFIVAPGGVHTIASVCRESLVLMTQQRLDAAAKDAAAKRLMDYVTGPICKTPLEQAISKTETAGKKLMQEMQRHIRDWRERAETYQTIIHDLTHLQTNIGRVLGGQEPIALEKPKLMPLALPLLTDTGTEPTKEGI